MAQEVIGRFSEVSCWEEVLCREVGAGHPLVLAQDPAADATARRGEYQAIGLLLAQYAQIEEGLRRLCAYLYPDCDPDKLAMGRQVHMCRKAVECAGITTMEEELDLLHQVVPRRNRFAQGTRQVCRDEWYDDYGWHPLPALRFPGTVDLRTGPATERPSGSADPGADFDYDEEMMLAKRAIGALVRVMVALVPG
jgi:hypothetical protein